MIGPIILFVISLAGGILWLYKIIKGNSSSSGSGNQNPHQPTTPPAPQGAGGHAPAQAPQGAQAGAAAGHGAHAPHGHIPKFYEVILAVLGGPLNWPYLGCRKATGFYTHLMMMLFCILNMILWRNTGTPFQYIFWGIWTCVFAGFAIKNAIKNKESVNPRHWEIHVHYMDEAISYISGVVFGWGGLLAISLGVLHFTAGSIHNEEIRQEARADMAVAKTKAESFVWRHSSPWITNHETEVVTWEEGPQGKVVFKSPLTTGHYMTVSYSAGSNEGTYEDTKDLSYKGKVEPVRESWKKEIPAFGGKSEVVGFRLIDGGKVEGILTFSPLELKWEYRKGTY